MAVSPVICTACGVRSGADRAFCTSCGRPLGEAPRALVPSLQTQFALPDYLKSAERRAAGRRSALEEPPGPGLLIAGAVAAGSALMFSSIGLFGGGLIAAGAALMLGGLWQQRADRRALERAGWAAAIAGLLAIGALVAMARPPAPADPGAAALLVAPEEAASLAVPAAPAPPVADMPMDRGDAARTGRNPGPGPRGRVVARWRAFAGGEVYASPVVSAGLVLLPTRTGALVALDAASGAERWRRDLGGYVARSAAAADGDSAYVASGYWLSAVSLVDGTLRWQAPIRFAGPSAPLMDRERVILATQEGSVYAFRPADGSQVWVRHSEGMVFGSVALADGRVYFGNERGQVFALDAGTGSEVWRTQAGAGIRGAPAISGGTLFVATDAGETIALATATGQERWRAATGGGSSPALRNGVVYVAPGEGGLTALDAATGAEAWHASGNGAGAGAPALAGDAVYYGEGRAVVAASARDGTRLWQFPTGGAIAGSPAVAGGMVFAGSADGYLYALGTRPEAPGGLEETGEKR
ncbi:MAG: PQQ-binding-like beta-propeller repeat protein [Chloroflexota bacterium]